MTSLESDDRKPTKTTGSNEPASFAASDTSTNSTTANNDSTTGASVMDAPTFPTSFRDEQYQAAQKFVDDIIQTERSTRKEKEETPFLHAVEIAQAVGGIEPTVSQASAKLNGEVVKTGNSLLRTANADESSIVEKIKSAAVTESIPIGTIRPTPRVGGESIVKDLKSLTAGPTPDLKLNDSAVRPAKPPVAAEVTQPVLKTEATVVRADLTGQFEGRVTQMINREPATNIDFGSISKKAFEPVRGDSFSKDLSFDRKTPLNAIPIAGREARSIDYSFHTQKTPGAADLPPTAWKDRPAIVQQVSREEPPYKVPGEPVKVASGVFVTDTKLGTTEEAAKGFVPARPAVTGESAIGFVPTKPAITEFKPTPDYKPLPNLAVNKGPLEPEFKGPSNVAGDINKVPPNIVADIQRIPAGTMGGDNNRVISTGSDYTSEVIAGSEYKPQIAGKMPVESISTPIASRPIEQISAPVYTGSGMVKLPSESVKVSSGELTSYASQIGKNQPVISAGFASRQEAVSVSRHEAPQQQQISTISKMEVGSYPNLTQGLNRVESGAVSVANNSNSGLITKGDTLGSYSKVHDPLPQLSDYSKRADGFYSDSVKYGVNSESGMIKAIAKGDGQPINMIPARQADLVSSIRAGNGDANVIKQIKMGAEVTSTELKGLYGNDLARRNGTGMFENAKSTMQHIETPKGMFPADLPSKPGIIYPKPIESQPGFKDPIGVGGSKPELKPFTDVGSIQQGKPPSGIESISKVPAYAGDYKPPVGQGGGQPIFGPEGKPINMKPADLGSMGIQKTPADVQRQPAGLNPSEISQGITGRPAPGEQALTQLPPSKGPELATRPPGSGSADGSVLRPPVNDGGSIAKPLAPADTNLKPPLTAGGDAAAKPAPGNAGLTDGAAIKSPATVTPPAAVGRGDSIVAKPPVTNTPADGGSKVPTIPADAGLKVNAPAKVGTGADTVAGATTRAPGGVDAAGTRPAPAAADATKPATPADAVKPIATAPKLDGTVIRPVDTASSITDAGAGKGTGTGRPASEAVTAFEQATQRIRQLSEGRFPSVDPALKGAVENILAGKVTTVRDAGTEPGARVNVNANMESNRAANDAGRAQGTARGTNSISAADAATGAGRRAVEAQPTSFEPQGPKQIAAKVEGTARVQVDVREPQVRADVGNTSPAAGIGRIPLSGSVRVTDFQPGRADGQAAGPAGVDGRAIGDVGRMSGLRGFNQVGDARTFTSHGEIRAPRGETHRYITGLELALILSIAGIAKLRGDSRNSAARLEGRTWSITRQQGKPMIYVDGRQNPFQPQRAFGKGDMGSAFRIMVSTTGDSAAKLSTRTMRSTDIATKSTADATASGGKLNMSLLGRYHYLNYFGKNLAAAPNNYYGQFRTTSYTGSMGLAFVMAAAGMTRGPLGPGLEVQGVDKLNPNLMGPADRIRMQNQNGLLTQFGRFNLDAVLGASANGREIGKNEENEKKDDSLTALDDYQDFLSRLDGFSKRKEDNEEEAGIINPRLTFGIENLYDLEGGEEEEVSEVDEDDDANNALSQVLRRPKWVVEAGQTLDGLAEKLFSNADLGWLIADLNRALIRETYIDNKRIVELQSRTEIELPVWQDIQKFNQARKKSWNAENLVTIVTERQIDREVVEARLAKVVGAEA